MDELAARENLLWTLERLAEKATAGPWFSQGGLIHAPDKGGIDVGALRAEVFEDEPWSNATYIVALLNAAPELIASLRTALATADKPLTGRDETWAWIPLWRELQRTCPECRSPKEAATENGYSCPKHRPLYLNVLEASRMATPTAPALDVERTRLLEAVAERAEQVWELLRHDDSHGHPVYDLGRALAALSATTETPEP